MVRIIPAEVEAAKLRTGPIYGGLVITLERREKVEGVLVVKILNAEVVDAEAESYLSRAMAPEADGVGDWIVPVVG